MKEEFGINKIKAIYNDTTIRVYQAYGDIIADEALQKGTFGNSFRLDRMTWIKPSFLWMMYRSDWSKREGQNRILAIDITRSGFDTIVDNAVLSSYKANIYGNRKRWKDSLKISDVRCQWDPDRDIYGNPLSERTIQLGIRGKSTWRYVNEWIVSISDITDFVNDVRLKKEEKIENIAKYLPHEKEYPKFTKSMM